MSSENLKILLREYESKHIKAQQDLEERKKQLFEQNPELKQIEKELKSLSISSMRNILLTDSEKKEQLIKELNLKIARLQDKKTIILKELNIDENFLKPNFECSLCNDTGYITTNGNTSMCNCLKQNLFNISFNECNLNNLDKENFSTFNFDNYSSEPNIQKYKTSISPRENIKKILELIEGFIKNFDNPDEKNLLFIGNTGLGKTFLSNCIANEILKMNYTVLYQTAPLMLDAVIDYRFGKTDDSFYKNLISVDLLIIDDLGTESINSLKFTELFNIINCRLLSKNTKTIISTNLDMKELYSRYDERLISRFASYYNICKFFGDDIRLKKSK